MCWPLEELSGEVDLHPILLPGMATFETSQVKNDVFWAGVKIIHELW